ncbi:MAG: hypothetical protein JW884_12810 [Deltaproteobacteria bacterium]|nr:hypothetical protein [Deltaproteobacteria bacterium]
MLEACLTPEERNRARAYDDLCIEQARQAREYTDRPFKNTALADLLNALIAEAMQNIKEYTEEIALFMKCKETFKDRASVDRTNFAIWMLRYKIEENHEDIYRWRSYKKESCRI